MNTRHIPTSVELPSSQQLLKSTCTAIVTAAVLLVTVVLPSEYAIDPTGIGRALGLTEMGEIKTQLAAEAEADLAATPAAPAATTAVAGLVGATSAQASAPVQPAAAQVAAPQWKDEVTFVLKPGEGVEYKLRMKGDAKAQFAWAVQGGVVNYDTHGDAFGKSISYEKGRAVPAQAGELTAAFTGNHGWFWRNRGQADVTMTLKVAGDYEKLSRQ
ncbi:MULTISPECIES: transmembrane anchor protein [Comamonas]|uniref:transmembrane anchor protein n=1 Tax=Comamonas TaxID=283 RepID=UPI00237E8226|nr:transmembrane anchor protein [Comamonas aquatica]MDE1555471.1 transmembrane anchor protein [Comamonas aquatica]